MKITICGSMFFVNEMLSAKDALEFLGHEVQMPPTEIPDEHGQMIPVIEYYRLRKTVTDETSWVWDRKAEAINHHFHKVAWADAILVLNHDKNDIVGYIGSNTFLEMGVAFYLGKRIFLLKEIPHAAFREELLGMKLKVLDGDLSKIV